MSESLYSTRLQLVRAGVGAAIGAVAGAGMAMLGRHLGMERHDFGVNLGNLVSVSLMGGGGYLLVLAADRRRLGRMLECDATAPASGYETRQTVLQGIVMILTGVLIAVPTLLGVLASQDAQVRALAVAATAALFMVQTWLNWSLVRGADDFARQMMLQAAGIGSALVNSLLFAWAALDRLGVHLGLRPWDVFVLLFALYVAASVFVGLRARGQCNADPEES